MSPFWHQWWLCPALRAQNFSLTQIQLPFKRKARQLLLLTPRYSLPHHSKCQPSPGLLSHSPLKTRISSAARTSAGAASNHFLVLWTLPVVLGQLLCTIRKYSKAEMIPLGFPVSHETGLWQELEMPGYSIRELQLFPAPRRAWERLNGQNPELAQGEHLGFCFCEWFHRQTMSSSHMEFLSKMSWTYFIAFLKPWEPSFRNISKVQGIGHLKMLPSEVGKTK